VDRLNFLDRQLEITSVIWLNPENPRFRQHFALLGRIFLWNDFDDMTWLDSTWERRHVVDVPFSDQSYQDPAVQRTTGWAFHFMIG